MSGLSMQTPCSEAGLPCKFQHKHWQLCVWGLPLTRRSGCCLLRLAKTLSYRAFHMNAGHKPHHATAALAC